MFSVFYVIIAPLLVFAFWGASILLRYAAEVLADRALGKKVPSLQDFAGDSLFSSPRRF